MIYLLWTAAILVLLILWLLFMPITLLADSMAERYELRQPGTFTMTLRLGPEPFMELRVFGIRIPLTRKKQGYGGGLEKYQLPRRPLRNWIGLIRRSVESLRIRSLVMDIDTGDVVINAELVPIMAHYSRGPISMRTNFQGRVFVHAEIQTRLNRLLWIIIQFLSKK